MVAKQTKTKRTRRKAVKKVNSSFLSYFVLGGFVFLAGFGWYHNVFEGDKFDKTAANTLHKFVPAPTTSPAPVKKETTVNVEHGATKIPIPTNLVATNPLIIPSDVKKGPVSVPYKADIQLPPQAKFAPNNAANIIFAKVPTTIYTKADSQSKMIAQVKSGQEMRSYEHIGGWHRVVVPSTDIIGWANEKYLTGKAPNPTDIIDHSMTGAIAP